MSLGLYSGQINANALEFQKYKVYRLRKISSFEPGCVVLASQLNSVFSTESFVTVQKQAEFTQELLREIKTNLVEIYERLAAVDRNLEKRDIVLKLLYRLRQNFNFSAMEAWEHTSVGIEDLISREHELFEEERNQELNRLLEKEEDTINEVRTTLREFQEWFQQFQR